MVAELSLLAVSFSAMIGIIAHKHYESTRGTHPSLAAVRTKADPVLQNVHQTTGRFISYLTIKNGVLLTNYIFVHIVRFLMHFSHKVHKISSDVVHKASKKKEDLTRGGAASFYLKKVKESARAVGVAEKGKIGDTVGEALDNK